MQVETLINKIESQPQDVSFEEVIDCITENYDYAATTFSNGEGDKKVINEAGSNEGSCKIFFFALLNELNESQTLTCFGKYYREEVLGNLTGKDHANIRNFMKFGWPGIEFEGEALKAK